MLPSAPAHPPATTAPRAGNLGWPFCSRAAWRPADERRRRPTVGGSPTRPALGPGGVAAAVPRDVGAGRARGRRRGGGRPRPGRVARGRQRLRRRAHRAGPRLPGGKRRHHQLGRRQPGVGARRRQPLGRRPVRLGRAGAHHVRGRRPGRRGDRRRRQPRPGTAPAGGACPASAGGGHPTWWPRPPAASPCGSGCTPPWSSTAGRPPGAWWPPTAAGTAWCGGPS
jgi:hypothetical protein